MIASHDIYDTALAKVIASHESGSTHVHRISSLYRSAEGRYFVVEEQEAHGVDGPLLTPLTDAMAREWLEKHGKTDLASSLFRNGRIFFRLEIDSDAAAAAAGVSDQEWMLAAIKAALATIPETNAGSMAGEQRRDLGVA
jgi:hypothetical protein